MERNTSKNPFEHNEDEKPDISTHLAEETHLVEDREPFNDAIDHFDIIHGYKSIKKLDQIPKRIQRRVRLFVIITLVWFFITICLSILSILKK